jgi:hypothetical protein
MSPAEAVARESIRHTLARYTIAGDRFRIDDYLVVFTDDAIMETEGIAAPDDFYLHGRDAIARWIRDWSDPSAKSRQPVRRATFVRHHLATCLIDITGPDTARSRTYWMAYTDIGPDHCGYYLDEFRRTGEEWLIAHRRIRLDWRSPNSVYTTASNTPR